ncbi:hypothetical protein GALMADRAFT_448445 [Galerina marginata CBS 339.88]|uniref:Uncharacterized protein n=1 Tax=Galerina marginata (strain CBS 339.88) TaxID=685588 RepID=A0A067T059_GALM3|nr:hypothetical protein GALMADRAFT_448445 [Galerina marginata CBS 339.88]
MTSQSNHSTLSLQSTTTAIDLPSPGAPKNFEAALGALQSRYGTGQHLPNPKDEPSTKLQRPSEPSTPGSGTQASIRPQAALNLPTTTPEMTPGSSQVTLSPLTGTLEAQGGSSSTNSPAQQRERSNGKKSFLKRLFKGKPRSN